MFTPSAGNKSRPTDSVIRMNISKRTNMNNFRQVKCAFWEAKLVEIADFTLMLILLFINLALPIYEYWGTVGVFDWVWNIGTNSWSLTIKSNQNQYSLIRIPTEIIVLDIRIWQVSNWNGLDIWYEYLVSSDGVSSELTSPIWLSKPKTRNRNTCTAYTSTRARQILELMVELSSIVCPTIKEIVQFLDSVTQLLYSGL